MSDKKQCIRCDRAIDAYARICPFCNWDQSDFAVPRVEQIAEQTYVPPPDRSLRKYVLMGIGAVVLLITSFALGSRVHGRNPPKTPAEEARANAPVRPAPHADVTLFPVNDTAGIEQPITSAPAANPAQGVPNEYQRSDATAVSSAEYAQLAARAQAEKKKSQPLVDPRTLTGPAYAQASSPSQISSSDESLPAGSARPIEAPAIPRSTPSEPSRISVRTRPVPEYQPIPDIDVREPTTVRLQLTINAEGRVSEVNVLQGVPGQTSKIISTVQTWRFKPATENGTPVPAPFSVDLSFRGNE